MLNLKKFLCLIVAVTVSLSLLSQQASLVDSINTRNQKPLKLVLNDTDHDGVTDQLDKETNTPAGCPVDTHGVTLDTDGDGVPDCRDKEKLTQQTCFPVDSTGVGFCPQPNCCRIIEYWGDSCDLNALPKIEFAESAEELKTGQEEILDSVALLLKTHAFCRVELRAYYDTKSILSNQLAEKRIKKILDYLTIDRGISKNRFTVNTTIGNNLDIIDLVPLDY